MGTRALIDGLRVNACVVAVAAPADVAAAVVAQAKAHGTRVAIAPADPLVERFRLVDALRAAGCDLLVPSDPAWNEQLPLVDAGVTGAALAVETPAALGLAAAPGVPRATSLVPPVHVCVVQAADVHPTFAEAVAALAATELPSALTWIGGPSRTSDLEMVQTLGIHGPRAVDVIVVREAP